MHRHVQLYWKTFKAQLKKYAPQISDIQRAVLLFQGPVYLKNTKHTSALTSNRGIRFCQGLCVLLDSVFWKLCLHSTVLVKTEEKQHPCSRISIQISIQTSSADDIKQYLIRTLFYRDLLFTVNYCNCQTVMNQEGAARDTIINEGILF